MRVYISGKVSGLPRREVARKFGMAAYEIALGDNTPVNPLDNGLKPERPWLLHMVVDIAMLARCDAICMLPDWRHSRGARIEHRIARLLRLRIFEPNNFKTMDEQKTTVQMTAEEAAQYAAFKAAQEKKAAAEQAKKDRETYAEMVDEEVASALPLLTGLSGEIANVKAKVLDNFNAALKMKSDVLKRTKDDQRSHTFTHSDGLQRITIGRHCCDGWKDTVNDGVAIVKEACLALIKDDTTRALVNQIMRLLARDTAGNLKANKALQLRKLANDLNNERLNEGITIIEESYIPSFSKTFIYAEVKDEKTGAWKSIPLGMTEA